MRLRARLQRLERKAGSSNCPGCRQRSWQVIVTHERELPDGTIIRDEVPKPCVLCGRLPEQVVWDIDPVQVLGLNLLERRPAAPLR
jgi:hypothetical protein